jgi:hypothetical protein
MELAVHLRENMNEIHSSNFRTYLYNHFNHYNLNASVALNKKVSLLERIYIGDEFCYNRLPSISFIDNIFDFVYKENLYLTLLTPILSEINLSYFSPILKYIYSNYPSTEIVVNDWGVLFFLKENFPSFNLAIGRILNKGFKDPRLKKYDCDLPDETLKLLETCTFDDPNYQNFVSKLGISRLETDVFPYNKQFFSFYGNLNVSLYLPYTYITSGRNCLTSINNASPKYFFVPLYNCSQPCKNFYISLSHSSFIYPVYQFGNTIFFKLSDTFLSTLLYSAEQYNIRIVYQGLAYENKRTC